MCDRPILNHEPGSASFHHSFWVGSLSVKFSWSPDTRNQFQRDQTHAVSFIFPVWLQPCSMSSTPPPSPILRCKPPPIGWGYPLGQHKCQGSESEGDIVQLLGHFIVLGSQLLWSTLSVLLSSNNCTNLIFTYTLALWPVWPWVSHLNSTS